MTISFIPVIIYLRKRRVENIHMTKCKQESA